MAVKPTLRSKLILSLVSLLVTLGLLEGAVRWAVPTVYKKPRQVVYAGQRTDWCCGPEKMDAEGIYSYIPHSAFQHCYDGPGAGRFDDASHCVHYKINNLGFRDVDHAVKKASNRYRILVLGDSFTAGEGVRFEDIYTQQLRQALEDKTIQGKTIEVINFGIPGAHTGSELQRYLKKGIPLQPDLIVVQWNTNDFPSSSLYKDHERLIGYQYRTLYKSLERYEWSRLIQWVMHRWVSYKISREILTLNQGEVARGTFNLQDIQAFRDVASSHGADFVLLIFPELIRFNRYPYANIVQAVETFCQNQNISVVNLLPKLAKHSDHELWVHETDHHPNWIAQGIAAEELRVYLEPRLDR